MYKKLEEYIVNTYDVYVLKFDNKTVVKENHRWGKFFVHYDDEYYSDFIKKVQEIIKYRWCKKV